MEIYKEKKQSLFLVGKLFRTKVEKTYLIKIRNELKIVINRALPGKNLMAKNAPIGKPNTAAIISDDILTLIDSQTISNKESSKDTIRSKAVWKASKNTCILKSDHLCEFLEYYLIV